MIKGFYAQHIDTGTWHKIEDVKDTGKPAHDKNGGNIVKLAGQDRWVMAHKLKGMEKKPPMSKSDSLNGGRADKKKPTDFCPKQLKSGTDHEMEHTNDKSIAQEIAMDHLTEDANYYHKLKEVEKYDRVDEEADGKKELDYGSEELDKTMKTKWVELKKAINNKTAIMNIQDQEEVDNAEDESTPTEDESSIPKEAGENTSADSEQVEQPEQEQPEQEQPEQEQPEQEQPEQEQPEQEQPEQEQPAGDHEQELAEMLRADGHSEAEINYITHGHVVPQATEDDYSAENERAGGQQDLNHKQLDADMDREHKQRDADRDHDHKGRMNDVEHQRAQMDMQVADPDSEKEHKKKMLQLEYDKAKAEIDMELEFKRKEFEQKMKLKEQSAKDKRTFTDNEKK